MKAIISPMKILIHCLFYLLFIHSAGAQNDDRAQEFFKKKFKNTYISLTSTKFDRRETSASVFNEIQVLDCRPDTSRLGIFMDAGIQREILFHSEKGDVLTASGTINQYLSDKWKNEAGKTSLLLVLKKFWITDKSLDSTREDFFSGGNSQTKISLSFESYIKDSTGYIPFAKFDTVFRSERPVIITSIFRLPELMKAFMDRLSSIDMNKIMKKKLRMSYDEVQVYSNRDYVLPIMAAQQLNKGVYASFDEFSKNNPSIHNYSIEKDVAGLQALFLKDEAGKDYYSWKCWGYCDGENIFMMMDGNLFPVIRYHNAYYVLGSTEYGVKKIKAPMFVLFPGFWVAGMMPIKEEVYRKIRVLSLDPVSGNIF